MRIVAFSALVVLLTGCSGQTEFGAGGSGVGLGRPTVTGSDRGGRVPYAEGDMPSTTEAMNAHCAKFGKKAQITQMKPADTGGLLEFECHGRKI